MTAAVPFEFAASDGLTLRGERWGKGNTPVLFTQGNGFCVQSYRDAFAPVADRVTMHALNCRGHGGSDVPKALEDWDGMVEDLRRYLKAHFPGPALVAAHSMGSTVCMRLIAESPELVAGLLLMEPLLMRGRREAWPENNTGIQKDMAEGALKRRDEWNTREEAAAYLRERGTYRNWAEGPFRAYVEHGLAASGNGVRLACPPWLESKAYATLPNAVMYTWVDTIRVPVVILRGERSQVVSAQGLEDFIQAAPITVVLKVDGPHSFPMTDPQGAGAAIAMGIDILLRDARNTKPASLGTT